MKNSEFKLKRLSEGQEKEVLGLIEKNLIEIDWKSDAKRRIFVSRFVSTIENEQTKDTYEQSHLVV